MPSDRWTAADFERRAEPDTLPELMDGESTYEDFRACLGSLEQINSLTLGYRPVYDFLARIWDRRAKNAPPLHIVDVGCGGGGLLRNIEWWARKRKQPVQLTGVDLNPYAARAARESAPVDSQIEFVTADIFSWQPSTPVDVVVSNLFTHHLASADVVRYLEWCEATAAVGWMVCDLYRSNTPLPLYGAAARLLGWHRFTRHDGPVSFRRAFREDDWAGYLQQAGLGSSTARVRKWFPARLCVERLK